MKISTLIVIVLFVLLIYQTHLNAQAGWQIVKDIGSTRLSSVHFSNSNIGTAVGGDAFYHPGLIMRTTDGGLTWIEQVSGVFQSLTAVCFTDTNNGIVVGYDGIILRTTNGGDIWIKQDSGSTDAFYDVSFADANIGIAVGYKGIIMRTTDGGITWNKQSNTDSSTLESVKFINITDAFAVGQNGTILKTTDAGITWIKKTSGSTHWLGSIAFPTPLIGYVTGYTHVYHTTNSGDSWSEQQTGTDTIPYFYGLTGVYFTDANHGTVVGNSGVIIHTTNGGIDWMRQTSGVTSPLYDIIFLSDSIAIIVGQQYILRTNTCGTTAIDELNKFPYKFQLSQNYPNPFNPSTTITYQLPIQCFVTLKIYDVLGHEIATLVDEQKAAGSYKTTWVTSEVPSGVYFSRLQSGLFTKTIKLLLLR